MGRSRKRPRRQPPVADDRLDRLISGWRRTEVRHGAEWNVQPVGTGRSDKPYTCPGCGGTIAAGLAHLVTWRADGVLGDRADLEARRHWHSHCWSI
ncbi:hypothetical protein GCM10010915_21620 [Microbacterium faecale]|uniref:ATP/GTP-binding protein n=1 Tax=Microbacterium faecale TaxID=1804630 RepID=A0A916YDE8_9MICO|nr:hypothetical protein [Microbacterium faecale]GGD40457.1 hypothetical protein GCM10010915_21620 [Microbacterium faecale]